MIWQARTGSPSHTWVPRASLPASGIAQDLSGCLQPGSVLAGCPHADEASLCLQLQALRDEEASAEGSQELSQARKGHLRCLLHMGHHNSLLAQVDGWSLSCSGTAPAPHQPRTVAHSWHPESRHLLCS